MIEQLTGPIDFLWVRVEEYVDLTNGRPDRVDELQQLKDFGRIRDVELLCDHEGTYVVFWTPGEPDTRPRCENCGKRYPPERGHGEHCSHNCWQASLPAGAENWL